MKPKASTMMATRIIIVGITATLAIMVILSPFSLAQMIGLLILIVLFTILLFLLMESVK